jgi:hypothetical protein
VTELQEIDLADFTGGLNLWRNQFNISPNQSPGMLNMEIDPRGGFYTRKGWVRWNDQDALGYMAHFDLPGTTGNYVQVPDSAALDLAGDVEIVVRVSLDDWTSGAIQTLVTKATSVSSTTGYSFVVAADGKLRAVVGDGAAKSATSSAVPALVDGTTYWLKVTFDLNNGAAGHDVKFYTAADAITEPGSWTQVGTTVTTAGAITAVSANTEPLRIGQATAAPASGKFYRVIVRNGIGGSTVFDTGGDDIPRDTTATSYVTNSGQTATVTKSGASYIVHADWEPRNTFVHGLSTGDYVVYVANNGVIEAAPSSGVFAPLTIASGALVSAVANPHLADFAAWGDYLYIACGFDRFARRRNGTGTPASITDAYGAYNDDYTTPDAIGSGAMPRCEFMETHGGYLFCAYTSEAATEPNRLRWSHPSQPENWAELDYIDIKAGGGKITGLRSFKDHLLIFKTDTVWALYGYDSDSWQLVRVSAKAGAPNTTAITSSESAVFFYSPAERGGVYAYTGGTPTHISTNLRTVMEETTDHEDVWVAWAGKRLWCSLPWTPDGRLTDESTVFVFDPEVGDGAWTMHNSALGNVKSIVEGSEIHIGNPLIAVCGCSGAAALLEVESRDVASDVILESLASSTFDAYYTTAWQNAKWLERRKSWRRPRFVMQQVEEDVIVDLDTYFDYEEGAPKRSHQIAVSVNGTVFWRLTGADEAGGFDWGDGAIWGASGADGSDIVRATGNTVTLSGLGVNRAIQLKFSTNSGYLGKAWGVNAMTLKYILRRFTT